MSLQINHITAYRDDTLVLEDVSLVVNSGDVIGIVGRNGVGKSTLLDCIDGTLQPQEGSISKSHVARLEQDILLSADQQTIAQWCSGLDEWQIDYIIQLAGIESTPGTLLRTLSGGQRTRLGLAKLITPWSQFDVLLLDEPTNNLDAEGLVWLGQILHEFRGAIVLVSHDRSLLNAVCTHIALIEHKQLACYVGNYNDFQATRQQERHRQQEQYEQARDTRKSLERQITMQHHNASSGSRKHANDNDKQARSFFDNRVGRRSGKALQALKSKLHRIDGVAAPAKIISYRSSLKGSVSPHKFILAVNDLSFSYGETETLSHINLELRGTERFQIYGGNGTGKSTLLKLIVGALSPTHGEATKGEGVNVGYFSQDSDQLKEHLTLTDQILTRNKDERTALFENAKALGLSLEDLEKTVRKLSRGQRAKAAILEILMNDYQLLVLDEPTNHLDIATRELFEEALGRYGGSIIFASHDKAFSQALQPSRSLTLI